MKNHRTIMQVDLWTDIVCPWCYIGVARFEQALAGEADVTVRVRPFQLDPDAPIPGVPAKLRYAQRFGDEADAILQRVTRAAEEEGLPIDFERAVSANTFDAHRAIQFAARSGRARQMERRLYRAYFADGIDVSDRDSLAELAEGEGCDAGAIAAHLASDDGVDELRRDLGAAFEAGITAVPSFVFNDEFLVPGAVDTGTFRKMLAQMRTTAG